VLGPVDEASICAGGSLARIVVNRKIYGWRPSQMAGHLGQSAAPGSPHCPPLRKTCASLRRYSRTSTPPQEGRVVGPQSGRHRRRMTAAHRVRPGMAMPLTPPSGLGVFLCGALGGVPSPGFLRDSASSADGAPTSW
jgi:hypothetical protein